MDKVELAARLGAYTPRDALEAEHLRRTTLLVQTASAPFDRSHWTPGHITASAFVLSPDERKLLLILHGKLGLWLQPGGHLETSDHDTVAAALREVREETGLEDVELLDPLFDIDVHALPPNPKRQEPAHFHFDVRVLLRARHEAAVAGDDALAARWVDLADIPPDDASVARAALKIRARGR